MKKVLIYIVAFVFAVGVFPLSAFAQVQEEGLQTDEYRGTRYEVRFAHGPNGRFDPAEKVLFGEIDEGTPFFEAVIPPTPLPDPGYYFAGWGGKFPERVTENLSYTARFEALMPITLTANSAVLDYNGEWQTVTGFTGVPKGVTVTGISAKGIGMSAAKDPYSVTFQGTPMFTDAQGNDVTDHYRVSYEEGSLTIRQAPLSITAHDKIKTVGQADPELTAEVEGLKGDDAIEYTLEREAGETAGRYAINIIAEEAENYQTTTMNGTLTVAEAPTKPIVPEVPEVPENQEPPAAPELSAPPVDTAPPVPPNDSVLPSTSAGTQTDENTAPQGSIDGAQSVAAAVEAADETALEEPMVEIADGSAPLADENAGQSETIQIDENQTPLASEHDDAALTQWSLLMIAAAGLIVFLLLFLIAAKKRRENEEKKVQP